MTKESVLITGSSGLVGSCAIDYFLNKKDIEIIASDINLPAHDLLKRSIEAKNFTFVKADLRNKDQLKSIIKGKDGHQITVLHIGGLFDYAAPEKLLFDVNVGGTENLFEILKPIAHRIKRVVIWSGGVVYGKFNEVPAKETTLANPKNAYGRSKLEQERIAFLLGSHLGIPVTVMRLGAIYGPRSKYGMGSCILSYANGQLSCFVFGSGKNRVALVHAEDTVRTAWFLSQKTEAIGEIYNVVDDCAYTMIEMAIFLGKELNNPVYKHVHLPKAIFELAIKDLEKAIKKYHLKPMIDPELAGTLRLDSFTSNAKLKALGFKFKYPDSMVGLKETIEWYRKEGWI